MGNILFRLTEGDLHRLVSESVMSILNEIGDTKRGQFALGAVKGRADARLRHRVYGYDSDEAKSELDRISSMSSAESSENGDSDDKSHKLYNDAGYHYGYIRGRDYY